MVERESTDTMIPSLNLNARVVVPLANLTSWCESFAPDADAKFVLQKCAGCKNEKKRMFSEEQKYMLWTTVF